MAGVSGATQGRRGYYLYEYGTHLWFPQTQTDWSAGMFRDGTRNAIPANGCYDAVDYLLDQPGIARKRGATTIIGNGSSPWSTVSYLSGVAVGLFPSGSTRVQKVVAITDQGDIIPNLLSGGAAALGQGVVPKDKPKMFIGGTKNLIVIPDGSGAQQPFYYDGSAVPRVIGASSQTLTVTGTPTGGSVTVTATNGTTASIAFNSSSGSAQTALNAMGAGMSFTVSGGSLPGTPLTITPSLSTANIGLATGYNSLTGGSSPNATLKWNSTSTCPPARFCAIHLSRVVLASTTANPNRIFFGPVLDPTGAWDSTAWIDANNEVSGLAVLNGALLVFSRNQLEKYVGDTPPPGTNFTHLTVDDIGCTDARSITVSEGFCYFANTNGVYRTDGVKVESMTDGRIGSYWRSLMSTGVYVADTGSIATGVYARRYLHVTVLLANRTVLLNLVCDLKTGAWWRISNNATLMYATGFSLGGANVALEELYGASATNGNGIMYSFMYLAPIGNSDADNNTYSPLLETRPFGGGPSLGAFGKGHITYDSAGTIAVSVATGIEAPSFVTVAESPLALTSTASRARFSTGKRSQAVTLRISPAASVTGIGDIYAIELDTRGFPREAGGQ